MSSSCADRVTAPSPASQPPSATLQRIDCRADVRAGTLACGQAGAGGARADLIVGGQGTYLRLASSGTAYDSARQELSSNVTVQNLLAQPMGTATGTDTAGIRVFFSQGPTVTSGSGSVTVANADGTGVFTGNGQPFFLYREILDGQGTTAPKHWVFSVPPTVGTFAFTLFVQVAFPAESGPLHWTRDAGPLAPGHFERIAGGGGAVYVLGDAGTLLRRTARGWSAMAVPTARDLKALWVADDGGAAFAGGTGSAVGYDGRRWSPIPGASIDSATDAAAGSLTDVWVTQTNGIAHFDGTRWSTVLTSSRPAAIAPDRGVGGLLYVGARQATAPACGCPLVYAVVGSVRFAQVTEEVEDSAAAYGLNDVWAATDGAALAVGWLKHDVAGARVGVVLRRDSAFGDWRRESEGGPVFTALAGTSDSVRYALTDSALYARTAGGWSLLPNSANPGVFALYLDGDGVLYGLAPSTVYRFEGGWVPELTSAPAGGVLNRGWAPDAGHVLVAGTNRFLRGDGTGWTETSLTGVWRGISGTSPDDVTMAGYRFDSTHTWLVPLMAHVQGATVTVDTFPRVTAAGSEPLQGVWAADAENVFVAGYTRTDSGYTGGVLARRMAGGWSISRTAPGDVFNAVSGSSASDVWAVGYHLPPNGIPQALFARYDGIQWTTTLGAANVQFFDVWAQSPTSVYAVGNDSPGGGVWHYDGFTWQRVYRTGTFQTLWGVWGTGPDDVYAVGTNVAVHYNGVSWTPLDVPVQGTLQGVFGSCARDVYAVGSNGVILHGRR